MANQQLMSPEALRDLIKAMTVYRESMAQNVQFLNEAANLCSQAMGNDSISARHIARLREVILEFDRAIAISEEAIYALYADLQQALDTLEGI